jgi:CheY-like chemotaxis protein
MDDEAMIREVAGKILARLGYEVACSSDGTEAITAYETAMSNGSPFDAVIMDLTIPGGMGGRKRSETAQGPRGQRIVSSGYSDDPIMANFTEYGFKASYQTLYHQSTERNGPS